MKRCHYSFLVLVGLLASAPQASANAGTPLMWAGMLHLAIGNAFIGLLEGAILGKWFDVPRSKAVGTMIAANYVSAWLGGLFIRGEIVKALPMDLTNGWFWFWVMVLVTFALTLLLEWPFVAWSFRGAQSWLARSVRASLVVQGSSYVILFTWYWLASGTSLYTRMDVVTPQELSLPESVLVYFISPSDGNVYRRKLVGGDEQKVYELRSEDKNDRLFVRPSLSDAHRWDLMARLDTGDHRNPKVVPVLTNLHVEAVLGGDVSSDSRTVRGTWSSFGRVEGLSAATNSDWQFWAGFWPIEGLRATRKRTSEEYRFSYETPFGSWTVRNTVHLPTDKVLFQLGADQICGFDPERRRVALLWRGRGPVPVIEKRNPN